MPSPVLRITVVDKPRAEDYRSAGTEVGRHIESLPAMAQTLLRNSVDVGCSGTHVADSIVVGLFAATANAGIAAERCQTLVEELERRAVLCDGYTRAVNTYDWTTLPNWNEAQASVEASAGRGGSAPPPGRRPERPEPPFRGAVHG